MASTNRQNEIRQVREKYHWFYPLVVGICLLAVGIWLGNRIFTDQNGYELNLFTELIGIGATVFVIDRLRAFRDRENLKARLVREVGSGSNEFARNAISWLRHEGWLEGDAGVLKQADLKRANLEGVDLRRANLQGARLDEAILRKADMSDACLRNAHLYLADLEDANLNATDANGAVFSHANMRRVRFLGNANLRDTWFRETDLTRALLSNVEAQNANFYGANLKDSHFHNANLEGANFDSAELLNAKLQGANLRGANLADTNLWGVELGHESLGNWAATLPDGTEYAKDECCIRFQSTAHPDYLDTLKKINDIRKEIGLYEIVITDYDSLFVDNLQ